jgi:hypothetical protein
MTEKFERKKLIKVKKKREEKETEKKNPNPKSPLSNIGAEAFHRLTTCFSPFL